VHVVDVWNRLQNVIPQICRSKYSAAPFETSPGCFETNKKHLLYNLETANMARGEGLSSPKVMRLWHKQKNWRQTKQFGSVLTSTEHVFGKSKYPRRYTQNEEWRKSLEWLLPRGKKYRSFENILMFYYFGFLH